MKVPLLQYLLSPLTKSASCTTAKSPEKMPLTCAQDFACLTHHLLDTDVESMFTISALKHLSSLMPGACLPVTFRSTGYLRTCSSGVVFPYEVWRTWCRLCFIGCVEHRKVLSGLVFSKHDQSTRTAHRGRSSSLGTPNENFADQIVIRLGELWLCPCDMRLTVRRQRCLRTIVVRS